MKAEQDNRLEYSYCGKLSSHPAFALISCECNVCQAKMRITTTLARLWTALKEFRKSNKKKQIEILQHDLNQSNHSSYNVVLLKPLRNKWDMEINLTTSHGFPEAEN